MKAIFGLKTVLAASLVGSIGSLAFAAQSEGQLAGRYNLTQQCSLSFKGETVVIPQGTLTISENIPVTEGLGTHYQAILLQSNGGGTPVLTLGIGKVQPFVYGPQAFSVGAYADDEFIVNYFDPKANGGATLTETIRLLPSVNGNSLIAVDETNSQSSTCFLGQKQ